MAEKERRGRIIICSIIFHIKAAIAFGISVYIFYYMANRVREEYIIKSAISEKQQARDRAGIPDPKMPFSAGDCPAVVGTTSSITATGTQRRLSANNRLEPPEGSVFFGFSLDFARDTVAALNSRLGGQTTAVVNAFTTINNSFIDKSQINWWMSECGKYGAILQLTVDPAEEIGDIKDETFESMADVLSEYNQQYGTPVLIRYGHEMNGIWRPYYSMRPTAYIKSFKAFHKALKHRTNMTAMLWSPNVGQGYPFTGDRSQIPVEDDTEDFRALDTNNNGDIDTGDDPYLPFYPGDEYVDWVGLSFYQYGVNKDTTTAYVVESINNPPPYRNFYDRFSDARGKPMALGESGAAIVPSVAFKTGATELSVKQTWWRTIFTASLANGASNANFPNLKLMTNFEEQKLETFDDADTLVHYVNYPKDYRFTFNDQVKNAFLADVSARPAIKWASALKYSCNGKVELK